MLYDTVNVRIGTELAVLLKMAHLRDNERWTDKQMA